MIEALLIFMLALRIGGMGISFWLWLSFFAIVKIIQFIIWLLADK
jgi:hypothetical protein